MKNKLLLAALFATVIIIGCKESETENAYPKQLKQTQTLSFEMETYPVHQLTQSQKDSLMDSTTWNGTKYIIPEMQWCFNPIKDCDGVWTVSVMEAETCTDSTLFWLRECPIVDWCQPVPPPFMGIIF